MQSLLNRPDDAVTILREGLSKGLWWNPQQFKSDSDFVNLLGAPGFAEVLEQCKIALEMARTESQTKLRLYPSSNAISPLLVALHMRGGNSADSAPFWEIATKNGWTVALPQSSQVYSMDGYCWDEVALLEREVADVLILLSTQHSLDVSSVVYGGASQGGMAAIYLALKYGARGFVAVVPSFGSQVGRFEWEGLLETAASKGVRGVVISGERDWALRPTQDAAKKMQHAGLQMSLEVVPNLGHDYPANMSERLKAALEFIIEVP